MNRKASEPVYLALLLCALACAAAACKTPRQAKAHSEWRPVFNGRSSDGWQMVGPGDINLERSELVTQGGMGLLWYSREKFGDCRIRVLFKPTEANDNSGVFIRIPEAPKDPWYAVNTGYEVQIDNRGDEWRRTGCLYSISKAKQRVNARVNEWNTMVITLEGRRTLVEINGALITDYTEGEPVPTKANDHEPDRGPRPNLGYIGLQNHDDNTKVHFREVSVAPLR